MKFRPARKVERLNDCLKLLPGEIEMAVKMRPTCTWTKRPRGALLYLGTVEIFLTVEYRWELVRSTRNSKGKSQNAKVQFKSNKFYF